MERNGNFTTIRSLLRALAISLNLIDPEVEHHHEQTAYMAYQIGLELGMQTPDLHRLVYAALLHDVGSVVVGRYHGLKEIEPRRREVAILGANMIRDLRPYAGIANIIEICQNSYLENQRLVHQSDGRIQKIAEIAGIIHMADVISALWKGGKDILNQVSTIEKIAMDLRGMEFSPECVEAFLRVSGREYVWMDFALNPSFLMLFTGDMQRISLEYTVELTRLMSRIIDFRSPFTAMHSAGVAVSAKMLAGLSGMTDTDCLKMEIAGNLHDVGKLRVPREILEKPGKLTEAEFNIIKEHPYYTRLILMDVEGFDDIANWAGFHHETLTATGYPFHLDAQVLDLGSRIMAVADIFTAVTEDRPYRKPMSRDMVMTILREKEQAGGIDRDIVDLLEKNYDAINEARELCSHEAGKRYFEASREKDLSVGGAAPS